MRLNLKKSYEPIKAGDIVRSEYGGVCMLAYNPDYKEEHQSPYLLIGLEDGEVKMDFYHIEDVQSTCILVIKNSNLYISNEHEEEE